MKANEIDIITLGCAKNIVDSEHLAHKLMQKGYIVVFDSPKPSGRYVVVNTCGFIQDAKQESIETILSLIEMKKAGHFDNLIVMGCLSQRYKEELREELPEVDAFYGKFDYSTFVADLPLANPAFIHPPHAPHRTTLRHYAYVKLSEGCDRHCAFCAIPLMTGHLHSRTPEEIVNEVNDMATEGVREIQLIAQELTAYGTDIDGHRHLAGLLADLADIPGIEWLRLHYAYPTDFPLEILDVMRDKPAICRYLDIAFQHISDHLLSDMHRHITKSETLALISAIRSRVPGIQLRTTLMVGFPGETEADFEELLDFVRWARFERMGAFAYSQEEGTYAALHYRDSIPTDVKQQRLDILMALQQEISTEIEAQNIGKTLRVIIDRRDKNFYIGRSEFSSPEIDPEVLIPATRRLTKGRFYNVKIIDTKPFDLYGEVID